MECGVARGGWPQASAMGLEARNVVVRCALPPGYWVWQTFSLWAGPASGRPLTLGNGLGWVVGPQVSGEGGARCRLLPVAGGASRLLCSVPRCAVGVPTATEVAGYTIFVEVDR